MAAIGMRYLVAAQIDKEERGKPITYKAGMIIGKAISAAVNWARNSTPLYADDVVAEDDNGITSGTIDVGADDLSNEVRVYVLGLEGPGTDGGDYEITDAAAPYVGFGYMRVLRHNNKLSYEAYWYHKVMFSETTENAATKAETLSWQTPTINGRMLGVMTDESGKNRFRAHQTFETEGAALAWLKGKANITAA